jgi:hypothetical protein
MCALITFLNKGIFMKWSEHLAEEYNRGKERGIGQGVAATVATVAAVTIVTAVVQSDGFKNLVDCAKDGLDNLWWKLNGLDF